MNTSQVSGVAVEVSPTEIRQGLWQVIPGVLSWSTLIGLTLLSFIAPYWIALFIIAYDIYILIRVVYIAVHLIYAYRLLHLSERMNWIARCQKISGNIMQYQHELVTQLADSQNQSYKLRWQLKRQLQAVQKVIQEKIQVMNWEDIHHVVILPTYDESFIVLKASLEALVNTDFPHDRMHIVVGFEDRVGQSAHDKAQKLQEEFGHAFKTFLITFHPDNLPGEKRVKSANATWAMKQMEGELAKLSIPATHVVISNFDSDTVVNPEYFSYLTHTFITTPDRYRASYQPMPVYNNNIWDAPAFSRVIATGSTFWQMIESTRPERFVTFSSHSMSLVALQDVGYWQKDVVSEDSRIFWQCLLHYDGNYRTEPMYTAVSMDAALAPTWVQTFINQYKQNRRWAWGIENFPYLAEGFLRNKKIPWHVKVVNLFRLLESHISWATSAIVVGGLGWLPIFFGGPAFHSTVLSYSLPHLTQLLMSIAMGGLVVSATLSLLLLPERPPQYSRWRYLFIVLQWVLVPVIATVLSAFPALDSETRLMFGRDLNFNVMQKARRTSDTSIEA